MFLEFFDSIVKLDDKECKKYFAIFYNKRKEKEKDFEKNIIFDLSYKILEECLKEFDKSGGEEEEKSNLGKMYSIGFIKIYFHKFVENYDKYGPEETKTIFDLVSNQKNKIIKVTRR